MLFQSDSGWQLALWFSVILNVNLAILNMLPIPVLDGGHIVLAMIESVRRKPVNIRILEFVQTGCAVLIIGYMAYVSFFDIGDWLGRDASAPKSAPATTHPSPAP
jgi:regulator of sigma E protease